MIWRTFAVLLCLCAAACRFGGPERGPKYLKKQGADAGASTSGQGGGAGASGTSGQAGAAGTAGAQGKDAAEPDPKDDAGVEPSTCKQPTTPPAVCDPRKATGCGLMMQCDVDALATTLAGYCTFHGAVPDGGIGCFASGVTQSCDPTLTCVSGACRKICLCDDDCESGDCCTEAHGTAGWKLCAPCP